MFGFFEKIVKKTFFKGCLVSIGEAICPKWRHDIENKNTQLNDIEFKERHSVSQYKRWHSV